MSFQSDIESVVNVSSTGVKHNTVNKDNVQVSSAVSHDAVNKVALNIGSEKLSQLMDRLSTTHAQLDDYTQKRTHQISIETRNIINKILEETKDKQRQLLLEAQTKSELFQQEYQNALQIKINQLNEEKAQHLAQLEKALNDQQELILINARQNIDSLQQAANQRKINVLQEAQAVTNARLEQIAEQVVHIGQEDSANRLASTTTTVITTQAVAQGQTEHIQQTYVQGQTEHTQQTYAQVAAHT
ncbi:unnamed protein product [Adineta steineri]|uniref:Uncharacterized protein n=1 Tax=Adineta steineri TaxID=433720 RepID=A0A814E1E8_9BILA|nr:unnamed protein product [Adineta steineri]CAF0961612.1 unnamed protein product [Adineta steineri]CAF3649892.1 unnamed protein product [Adineta steineri]CAF3804157.1 unnamed protein product [Adineta steineri]